MCNFDNYPSNYRIVLFFSLQSLKNIANRLSMLENMMKHLMDRVVPNAPVAEGISVSDTDKKPEFEFKPVAELEEIKQLEEKLENEEYRNQFYAHFTKRMGTDIGSGKGEGAAFDLVDEMFTRNFFLSFSWTGNSSTSSTGSKVALNKFIRTVDIFFQIIHNCDKTYSFGKTKHFFQKIMCKSKTRAALPPRANRKRSAPKNRRSGLVYRKKNKNEGNENGNEDDKISQAENNALDEPSQSEIDEKKNESDEAITESDSDEDK